MSAIRPLFQLHITGEERAPVLVLANSLGATIDMWAPQLPWWQSSRRIVRFDYGGHAGSDDSLCRERVEDIAQLLFDSLGKHGIHTFSMAGVSLGGQVALATAARFPSAVTHLVVANARPEQSDQTRAQWDERIKAVQAQGMDAIAAATVQRWLTTDFAVRHSEEPPRLLHMLKATSIMGYTSGARAVRDFKAVDFAAQVRCPSMVIAGREDMAAPTGPLQQLARDMDASYLELSRTAHLSNIEAPAAFAQAVAGLLA